MSEHELLLRHAERWASEKKRTFDADLVDTALELRATHDDGSANRWPSGSVRHLMLERWPSHGPAGVPDVALLVESLDTFWRFLRGTGRMAMASADPKVLASEAKAAAKKMPEACANPANFGAAKGILQFGREQGFDLDNARSVDDLNAMLQQVVTAWNDQQDQERPEELLPSPPVAEAAPFARESRYVRQVLTLADWADGKEVTSAGLLRPAVAREAFDDLDLWQWQRRRELALQRKPIDPAHEAAMRDAARNGWRSARDCIALDRLWAPAVSAGLIDTRGKRARRVHGEDPVTDEDWVTLSHVLNSGLVALSVNPTRTGSLLSILFSLAEEWGGGPRTLAELQEIHWAETFAPRLDPEDLAFFRPFADDTIALHVNQFDDCGWWQHQFGRLALTPLGWSFALNLTAALDEGWLWPEEDYSVE